jgi:DNA repair exonuclease SbcCD ATPase subunit
MMFSYPLLRNTNTQYHKLNITPEATQQQIQDAMVEMRSSLRNRKSHIQKKLKRIYESVPELPALNGRVITAKKSKDDLSELKDDLAKKKELEKKALSIDAAYQDYIAKIKAINDTINEINNMKLGNPEERKKYDLATPPCSLLKLSAMDLPLFSRRPVALLKIREALAEYLEKTEGLVCYHPSDFTKTHFEIDFSYSKLLDEN